MLVSNQWGEGAEGTPVFECESVAIAVHVAEFFSVTESVNQPQRESFAIAKEFSKFSFVSESVNQPQRESFAIGKELFTLMQIWPPFRSFDLHFADVEQTPHNDHV